MVSGVTHHIVGVHELATRWRISRQRVHVLLEDGKIPAAAALLGKGNKIPVWDLHVIEEWEQDRRAANLPLPGESTADTTRPADPPAPAAPIT